MSDHNIGEAQTENYGAAEVKVDSLSESEEMYIITIAGLVESGHPAPVALSLLAQELAIRPVSVNQMIHRLDEAGWVRYLPYKGVKLTGKGKKVAARVLRCRRLWEVFLAERLGLPVVDADSLACRLEHVTPRQVVSLLADYLGHPAVSPLGLPIPEAKDLEPDTRGRPLGEFPVGGRVQILSLEGQAATRSFLNAQGIQPGIELTVLAAGERGDRLLNVGGTQVHLSGATVAHILAEWPRKGSDQSTHK